MKIVISAKELYEMAKEIIDDKIEYIEIEIFEPETFDDEYIPAGLDIVGIIDEDIELQYESIFNIETFYN